MDPSMMPEDEAEVAVPAATQNMDHIFKIPVTVDVVLGSATMSVAALMKLGKSAVVTLDRKVGDPVDLAVTGKLVARGEIVVLDGGAKLGVSLTEVLGPDAERSI